MKSMQRMVSVAVLVATSVTGTLWAQVAEDAKAVLNESKAAVNAAEGMTYKVRKYGSGPLKEIVDLSGTVKLMRAKGAPAPTTHINGRWKEPGKKDMQMVLTNDGSVATWLSYADNTKYQAQLNDAKSREAMAMCKEFLVTDMVNGQAYETLLKMPKVEKRGVDQVAGEMCDLIVGTSEDGSRIFTYAISVADRIPRKIEMATGEGENKFGWATEITEVAPAKLTAKDFEIAKPEGFVDKVMGANPATQPAMPPVDLGPKVGEAVPSFTVTDSTGKTISPDALKGKATVLMFFGSMFKASVAGAVEMQLLADEMKGTNFIGLACREMKEGAGAAFFKTNQLTFTLVPKGDEAAAALNVKGYPSYVILDKEGKVATFFQDNPGKDKLSEAVKAAGGN